MCLNIYIYIYAHIIQYKTKGICAIRLGTLEAQVSQKSNESRARNWGPRVQSPRVRDPSKIRIQ